MGWRVVSKLKQFILTINNTDIELNNFDSCLPFNTEANIILSNPIPNMGRSESYGYSDRDNPSQYAAAYSSLVPGTLNFFSYYQIMNTGESLYIWRQDIGRNVRMEFTKSDGKFICIVKWYNYTSPTIDIPTERAQYPNIDVVFSSIGFLIDVDNGLGSFYSVNAWNDTKYTSRYQLVRRGYSWGWSGGSYSCAQGIFALLFGNEVEPSPSGGPYVTDDYDTPIGGNDDPDDTSDTITEDALPTIGATVSGLCTAYVPTLTQMQALANQLVDPTWYQALGSTVLNVSDAVIGLQVLPFVVPSTLSQNQWKLNFLGISLPSGIYLNKANQQFCEVPCGTIHVTPYWNNCLDYNPYTQISVFLPFCGFFELDTDDVMDHDLEIKYRVDIMSGACLATIKVDGSIMYQFAGECGNQIPVSSVSFDNFLQSAMQLAITTASGSIGLAAAGASATMQKEKIAMSDMSAGDKQIAEDAVNTEMKFKKSQNGVGLLAATAGAVISAKGQYKHAGCIAGSPGFLGVRKPYLIIKRPKQIMPSLYGDFRGYPTNTVMKLSDCHGYTEVDSIRLNIPNATVDEIYECETLLKEGVVFD